MRRNQKNHKRRSTKLVQRPLIYTWYLPSNFLPSSFFLLPYSWHPLHPSSESVAELPTDIGLTSVTSVTSVT